MSTDEVEDAKEVAEPAASPSPAPKSRKPESKFYARREADSRFVGLLNQGATCYLNSLLQILFVTPEIRHALMQWWYAPPPPFNEAEEFSSLTAADSGSVVSFDDPPDFCITYQLQCLFARLTLSKARFVSTKALTKSFHWDSGQQLQQQDVQEFLKVLFDAMQRGAKPGDDLSKLDLHWQGTLKDALKCRNCADARVRTDLFTDISLVIDGKHSLEQALDDFAATETLCGGNQVFCDFCGGKQDFDKGLQFGRPLPTLLFIQLKRFYYDYAKDRRVKLTHKVTFPFELDMSRWTPTAETADKRVDDAETESGELHVCGDSHITSISGENVYELYGVVIQSGGAFGGHYWALIKSFGEDGDWYKFNDASVTRLGKTGDKLFDYEFKSAFGGERVKGTGYVVVYRKKNVPLPTDLTYCHPHFEAIVAKEDDVCRLQQLAYEREMRSVTLNVFTNVMRPMPGAMPETSGEMATTSRSIRVDTGEVTFSQLHQLCIDSFYAVKTTTESPTTEQPSAIASDSSKKAELVVSQSPSESQAEIAAETKEETETSAVESVGSDTVGVSEEESLKKKKSLPTPVKGELSLTTTRIRMYRPDFDFKSTVLIGGDDSNEAKAKESELISCAGLNRYHCNLFVERLAPSSSWTPVDASLILVRVCAVRSEDVLPIIDSFLGARYSAASRAEVLAVTGLIDQLTIANVLVSDRLPMAAAKAAIYSDLKRQGKVPMEWKESVRKQLAVDEKEEEEDEEEEDAGGFVEDAAAVGRLLNAVSLSYHKCRVLDDDSKALKDCGVTVGDFIYLEIALSDAEISAFEVCDTGSVVTADSGEEKGDLKTIGSVVYAKSRLARVYEEQKLKATIIYNLPTPVTAASELMRQLVLSKGKATVDTLRSTMRARVEYSRHVRVSLNATVAMLKLHIAEECALESQSFRLRKGKNLTQYTDLSKSVEDCGLSDGSMVYVETGPPSLSSELMVCFTLYDAKKQWTDPWKRKKTLWPRLFEHAFARNMLVSEMKQVISKLIDDKFPPLTESQLFGSDNGEEEEKDAVADGSSAKVEEDESAKDASSALPKASETEARYSLLQAVSEMKARSKKKKKKESGDSVKSSPKKKKVSKKKVKNARNLFDCEHWRIRKINGARVLAMLFDNVQLGHNIQARGDVTLALERTIMKERFTAKSICFKLHRFQADEGSSIYGKFYGAIEMIMDKTQTVAELRKAIHDFYRKKKAFADLRLDNISIAKGFSTTTMSPQMVSRLKWPHLQQPAVAERQPAPAETAEAAELEAALAASRSESPATSTLPVAAPCIQPPTDGTTLDATKDETAEIILESESSKKTETDEMGDVKPVTDECAAVGSGESAAKSGAEEESESSLEDLGSESDSAVEKAVFEKQRAMLAAMDEWQLGQPQFHLRNGDVLVWRDISRIADSERLKRLKEERAERQRKLRERLSGRRGHAYAGGKKRKIREGPKLVIQTHREWEEEQLLAIQLQQIEEQTAKELATAAAFDDATKS